MKFYFYGAETGRWSFNGPEAKGAKRMKTRLPYSTKVVDLPGWDGRDETFLEHLEKYYASQSLMGEDPKRLITVCSACKTAACWHGEFYCEKAKEAGTIELPRYQLLGLGLEHPSNFSDSKLLEVTGQ